MDLDKKLEELKSIVAKLEGDNISFQEGVQLYENGAKIAKEAIELLNESKGRVVKIKQDLDSFIEEKL